MIVDSGRRFGLLIAAHGGRDAGGHSNESIFHLARDVAARIVGVQVGCGFINGVPTIADAIESLAAANTIVYPLFMAAGYFGDIVLNRLIEIEEQARQDHLITILPPLGLDPALADLVVANAASAAASHGVSVQQLTLVLLAHGSSRNPHSAIAAEQTAKNVRAHKLFDDVRVSFLDELPSLETTVSEIRGRIAIVGLFSGDGLHGGADARRLMAQLERNDVIYVGNVGLFSGLEKLIATAVNNEIASANLGRASRPAIAQVSEVVPSSDSPR